MSENNRSWEEAVAWLKAQPSQLDLVRSCYYDDPLIDAAQRYYRSAEWNAIRSYLPKQAGHAMDLGAGRGIASYALAMDGWDVTAVEPDGSALVGANAIRSLAKEAGLQIRVEENCGERLPFQNESFDLVHARQVLHHARDLRQLCKEMSRVLKKTGVLIATREHVISRKADLPKFQANHALHKLYWGENAYTLAEYLSALRDAGFRLTSVLNPLQSDINLFPETKEGVKRRIAGKVGLPGTCIPDWFLSCFGRISRTPGRLYTFVAQRSDG